MAATTADESTPPDRNAPSGTSAISRARVASTMRSRRWRRASSYDSVVFVRQSARQYVSMRGSDPAVHVSVDAGGRRRMPLKMVRVPGIASYARYRSIASGSTSRGQFGSDEQRFDLGGEVEPARILKPVERLLARAIAREEQLARVARPTTAIANMPRRCGIARRAAVLDQVDEHLGVAARAEAMAARLEIGPQLAEVVDLAVER